MALPLGAVNFGLANINLQNFATALQQFLVVGSRRNTVSINDLTIVSDAQPISPAFVDVNQAITEGTKLIDALYYFSLPIALRPVPVAPAAGDLPPTRDLVEISRAFFFECFLVLTRGRPSDVNNNQIGAVVPAFLPNILAMQSNPRIYADLLASFDLNKIDWRFIRYFDFTQLGQESLNRLGLGVAGYRMLQPFKLVAPTQLLTPQQTHAYNFFRHIAVTRADWAIHPVTRSAAIIQQFGSLNNNAGNLILDIYTQNEINAMVASRMLFAYPVRDQRSTEYTTWDQNTVILLNDPIF